MTSTRNMPTMEMGPFVTRVNHFPSAEHTLHIIPVHAVNQFYCHSSCRVSGRKSYSISSGHLRKWLYPLYRHYRTVLDDMAKFYNSFAKNSIVRAILSREILTAHYSAHFWNVPFKFLVPLCCNVPIKYFKFHISHWQMSWKRSMSMTFTCHASVSL